MINKYSETDAQNHKVQNFMIYGIEKGRTMVVAADNLQELQEADANVAFADDTPIVRFEYYGGETITEYKDILLSEGLKNIEAMRVTCQKALTHCLELEEGYIQDECDGIADYIMENFGTELQDLTAAGIELKEAV